METSILNINNNYSPSPLIIETFEKRTPSVLRGSKGLAGTQASLASSFFLFFYKEVVRMFFHVCN